VSIDVTCLEGLTGYDPDEMKFTDCLVNVQVMDVFNKISELFPGMTGSPF
jgi:hypothetical protein